MRAHTAHRARGARVGHDTGVEAGPVPADLPVSAVTVRAAAGGRGRCYKGMVMLVRGQNTEVRFNHDITIDMLF